MKRFATIAVLIILVLICATAQGDAIKVNGLSELKLYEMYSQVQSQLLLNKLADDNEYKTTY